MRLIDADALEKRIIEMCPAPSQPDYTGDYDEYVQVAQEMVVDVLEAINSAPIISSPLNAPLTLDELREMDGEPVWCVSAINSKSEWAILHIAEQPKDWFISTAGASCGFGDKDTYGKTWWAYHCKPESGTI